MCVPFYVVMFYSMLQMSKFVWKNCVRRLSGQKRTTTYLDPEQELVMPETGYQLLHNYADQNSKLGLDLQHSFSSFKIIYQELKSDSQASNICHTSCGSVPVIWFIDRTRSANQRS